MPAVIQSTLYVTPGGAVVPGSTQLNSRDDLRMGYQVVLHSVNVATTYSWTLAFASDSPGSTVPGTPFDGTASSAALLAPEGSTSQDAKFNVDFEGTYLIRLVVDAGLPTEDTQFIRCRALTMFGALKLVAAGERRDQLGVIPVDASPEGWANDQNANLQRIAILLRRLSTSGRVVFVDANRGRDNAATQNDYDNLVDIPGPDSARLEETGIKLRAMSHGDFSSINEAITYASAAAARGEPAPSKTNPYYVVIRPGLYLEDLNLTSFVHLIGEGTAEDNESLWTGGPKQRPVVVRTVNAGGVGTHRYNPQALGSAVEVFLHNLTLENTAATSNPVLDHQGGALVLTQSVVHQKGNDALQGEAVRCVVANPLWAPSLWVKSSFIRQDAAAIDRVALRVDATGSTTVIASSVVQAPSSFAMLANESLYSSCSVDVRDGSIIDGAHGYDGYAETQTFHHSEIRATGAPAFPAVNIYGAGPKAGNVTLNMRHCHTLGAIWFASANALGTSTYNVSGLTQSGVTGPTGVIFLDAPGDVPDVLIPEMRADTLRYVRAYENPSVPGAATIPLANQVAVEDVQRILDILWLGTFPVSGSPFYSLESAYNGLTSVVPFTPGVGLGRNINALGGAVQIQGATFPTGVESHLKYGGLQVEGVIDIGGFINGGGVEPLFEVGGSEIHLNPNQAGGGPFVGLGRATWPNGVTQPDRGFAGGLIVAGGAQAPAGVLPYHLHLRSTNLRTPSTGKTGNVYVVAGAIGDAAGAGDAGEVHLIGGSHFNAAGTPGNLWLVPGNNPTPSAGAVWFIGAPDAGSGALRCSLTPAGVYVGGVAGTIVFSTPAGLEVITLTGLEINAALAAAAINAQARGIQAADVIGRVVLSGEFGPAGDILYLGDTMAGALNTALGDYILANGAVFVPGAYGDAISVDVPQNGRLRVNGDLEVTGTIIGASGLSVYQDTAAALYNVALGSGIEILGVSLVAGVDTAVVLAAAEPTGRTITIKDESGTANAIAAPAGQKISISDAGAATFDGATPLDITSGYGAVTLYKNVSGNWSII